MDDNTFQSTHPRGVRRADLHRPELVFLISIHAPTWGATWRAKDAFRPSEFQSTHPRGVRPTGTTWGTTGIRFQSTHPRGVRHAPGHTSPGHRRFQSTHPRGVRPPQGTLHPVIGDFNPRTHVGCDVRRGLPCHWFSISIHAPTWGATVKPSNGWLLGHKDTEFANENIIIINSVNITWLSQPYYWCSTIANISALSATLGVRICQIMSSSVKSVSLLSLKVSTLCFQFDPNE